MSVLRKLFTDADFQEAVEAESLIRVFSQNQIVEHRAIVIRFDEQKVITQSNVSDLMYHNRDDCEFFLLKPSKR